MATSRNSWKGTYQLYEQPLNTEGVQRRYRESAVAEKTATSPTPKDKVHEYVKGINASFVAEKYGKAVPIHYFGNDSLPENSKDIVLQMLRQRRCAATPAVRCEVESALDIPILPGNSKQPEVVFAFKCENLEQVLR